jgi:hypothetical protein
MEKIQLVLLRMSRMNYFEPEPFLDGFLAPTSQEKVVLSSNYKSHDTVIINFRVMARK